MITFEQTFRSLLLQSNLVSDRVFLLRAPQTPAAKQQLPYLVFFNVGHVPMQAHTGPPLMEVREYQLSFFDNSQMRALAIGDSMRLYLNGYRGTFQNVRFGAIFHRTQSQTWETETQLCHVIQQYRIEFRLLPSAAANRSTQPQLNSAAKE